MEGLWNVKGDRERRMESASPKTLEFCRVAENPLLGQIFSTGPSRIQTPSQWGHTWSLQYS
jgi:hypothetical protein